MLAGHFIQIIRNRLMYSHACGRSSHKCGNFALMPKASGCDSIHCWTHADQSKWRPLGSYCSHILKQILGVGCKSILCMLSCICSVGNSTCSAMRWRGNSCCANHKIYDRICLCYGPVISLGKIDIDGCFTNIKQ